MEREREAAARKARQEAEELALNVQRERERVEKDERDAKVREEKERIDSERNQRLGTKGGVRGVRGTRASMRGAKAATSTRGGMHLMLCFVGILRLIYILLRFDLGGASG